MPYTGLKGIDRALVRSVSYYADGLAAYLVGDLDDGELNRYFFDFNLDTSRWEQFDTDQDAWYFGV